MVWRHKWRYPWTPSKPILLALTYTDPRNYSAIYTQTTLRRIAQMVKVHHLQSKLKSLRLGGMLDTLELRLDQAQKDHLGYLQFLELMLEDEINRRSQRSLT